MVKFRSLPGMTAVPSRSLGLGWALWSVAIAVVWVLPTRTPPWATFYAEALMAACVLVVGVAILFSGQDAFQRRRFAADWASLALLALATVPLFHGALGLLVFPGESLLQCLYLLAIAMTHFIARSAWEHVNADFIDCLWAGLVIAAVISAGLAIYQWLRVDRLGWLVSAVRIPGRPDANVGQPNNLATLLCWGLVGFWWAFSRRKLGGAVAVFGAAFLLVGVALTQSRTAWLMLAVFPLVLFMGKKALGGPSRWAAVIGLALWFIVVKLALPAAAEWLDVKGTRDLSEQLSAGTRPMTWQLALDAIAARPWAGFGWNQFLIARVEFINQYPQHPEIVSYAHNFVLDLLVWSGVVVGGLAVVGLGWWLWSQLRGVKTVEQWLLLVGLGVLLVHAMLELPHAYAYFLLPAAAMAGTLSALRPSSAAFSIPRWCVGLVLVVLAGAWVALISDYREIESRDQARRIFEAGIASRGGSVVEEPLLILRFVSEINAQLRQRPRKDMRPEELARWRTTLMRYPVASSLVRFAQASVLNQQPEGARWALVAVCGLYERQLCEAVGREWADFSRDNPEASLIAVPTSPRSH